MDVPEVLWEDARWTWLTDRETHVRADVLLFLGDAACMLAAEKREAKDLSISRLLSLLKVIHMIHPRSCLPVGLSGAVQG